MKKNREIHDADDIRWKRWKLFGSKSCPIRCPHSVPRCRPVCPPAGTPWPGLGNRQIAAVGRNLCTTGGKTGCGEKNRGAAVGNSWKIGGDNRGIGWEIRPAPPGPSPSGCPHPFPPVFHGLIHRPSAGSRRAGRFRRRPGAARARSPAPPARTGDGLGEIPRKEANTSVIVFLDQWYSEHFTYGCGPLVNVVVFGNFPSELFRGKPKR